MQTNARVNSISLLLVLILRYSEVFLKAISRAKKSALEMKIGQIIHHTLLFLRRFRHLEFPVYVFCYGALKSCGQAILDLEPLCRVLYGPSFENNLNKAGPVANVDKK